MKEIVSIAKSKRAQNLSFEVSFSLYIKKSGFTKQRILLFKSGYWRAATPTMPIIQFFCASLVETNTFFSHVVPSITCFALKPKYCDRMGVCSATHTDTRFGR